MAAYQHHVVDKHCGLPIAAPSKHIEQISNKTHRNYEGTIVLIARTLTDDPRKDIFHQIVHAWCINLDQSIANTNKPILLQVPDIFLMGKLLMPCSRYGNVLWISYFRACGILSKYTGNPLHQINQNKPNRNLIAEEQFI